jgi:SPP1 gp7 family putative phage head morphogenesis protein
VPLGLDVFADDATLTAARQRFVSDNVALIRTLPERTFAEIERRTKAAISRGARPEDLAAEVRAAFGAGEYQARRIGRDQVNKHNGRLTQIRQQSAGVVAYRWSATLDARTRPEHYANHGTIQQWNDPPPTGHPGEAIQCRCVAIPTLEGLAPTRRTQLSLPLRGEARR